MGIRNIFSRNPNYPKEFKKKYDDLDIRTKGIKFVDSKKKQDLLIFYEKWLNDEKNSNSDILSEYEPYRHFANLIINILRGFYDKDSVMEAYATTKSFNSLLGDLGKEVSDKKLYEWYLYEIEWLINNIYD